MYIDKWQDAMTQVEYLTNKKFVIVYNEKEKELIFKQDRGDFQIHNRYDIDGSDESFIEAINWAYEYVMRKKFMPEIKKIIKCI